MQSSECAYDHVPAGLHRRVQFCQYRVWSVLEWGNERGSSLGSGEPSYGCFGQQGLGFANIAGGGRGCVCAICLLHGTIAVLLRSESSLVGSGAAVALGANPGRSRYCTSVSVW